MGIEQRVPSNNQDYTKTISLEEFRDFVREEKIGTAGIPKTISDPAKKTEGEIALRAAQDAYILKIESAPKQQPDRKIFLLEAYNEFGDEMEKMLQTGFITEADKERARKETDERLSPLIQVK